MPGIDYVEIMGPALVAGLMIAFMHAPLGIEVLRRGIVFIDLAIAQIAGLYVVLINIWSHEPPWGLVQLAAVLSAICAAILFRWVERVLPREQEAIIGCTFILAASAMLLALADNPHGGEQIQHVLVGQILFVRWTTILAFAPVYVIGACLWFLIPAIRQGLYFFCLFAVIVTASVQLVGVYVVFASLILPALAVNPIRSAKRPIAIATGMTGVILGLVLSMLGDLPAGPALVFSTAFAALVVRIAHARQPALRTAP